MIKARIQEGFPKLGILTVPKNSYSRSYSCFVPRKANGSKINYRIKHNELIIAASYSLNRYDGASLRVIPFRLIQNDTVSIRSVLTWVKGQKHLPQIPINYFIPLVEFDIGKDLNKIFA